MNIALVESNDRDRRRMEDFIGDYCRGFELPINMRHFTSDTAFLTNFSPGSFDAVIFTISAEETLRAAKLLRRADNRCKLIVVAPSDNYATESYDLNAVYYLKKPIEPDALKRGLERCIDANMRESRFIEVVSGRHHKQILMSDIQYAVVCKNAVQIYTTYGMEKVYTNFRSFAPKLLCDNRFIQSYYGCIINMDYVRDMDKNQFILHEGKCIGIRKKGSGTIKAAYIKYSRRKSALSLNIR